jgi:hypothetical protein
MASAACGKLRNGNVIGYFKRHSFLAWEDEANKTHYSHSENSETISLMAAKPGPQAPGEMLQPVV